jgi:hypothetical protein
MKLTSLAILVAAAASIVLSGCQSNMGRQTLPSANSLRDDVQYHPAGTEERLPNQRHALEQYRSDQAGHATL